MQENGRPGFQSGGHIGGDRRRRCLGAPVAAPRRPQHGAKPEPAGGQQHGGRQGSVRRPEPDRLGTSRVRDGVPGQPDVGAAVPPEPGQVTVVPLAVDGDLVATLDEFAGQRRGAPRVRSEEEEGRLPSEPVESVEHHRCRRGVGAVVERQRHVVGAADPGQGRRDAAAQRPPGQHCRRRVGHAGHGGAGRGGGAEAVQCNPANGAPSRWAAFSPASTCCSCCRTSPGRNPNPSTR